MAGNKLWIQENIQNWYILLMAKYLTHQELHVANCPTGQEKEIQGAEGRGSSYLERVILSIKAHILLFQKEK